MLLKFDDLCQNTRRADKQVYDILSLTQIELAALLVLPTKDDN